MSLREDVFDLLSKPIRRLIEERGFLGPTEPQARAIPLILEGKNVLLIAPTSTGKTEAALLPVLDGIISSPREMGVKALYITPLRALNRDLLDRILWWCSRLDLKASVRHGDTAPRERRRQALSPPDILITTPETLQILLNGRLLSRHLKTVRWVIVDEVHELADNKRGSQLSLGLEKLRWTARRDFQIIGLSATVGTPERVASFLVGVGRDCEVAYVPVARGMRLRILYPRAELEDEALAEGLYTYPDVAARLRVMRRLVEEKGSALLFTNTRPMAEVLASRFRIWDIDFPVSVHHGSLSFPSRERAERGLKMGTLKGVVCTSSLELGIDVGTIDLCIQYNSPRQVTRLIQRVGRSGHRIGGVAEGVIIVQNSDDALESMVIARRALREDLEPVSIPDKPLDVLMHELVGLLIVKRNWDVDEAYDLVKASYPYSTLEREELEDLLNYMSSTAQRLLWFSPDHGIFSRSRYKRIFEYYYGNISMIPVAKQFLVVNDRDNLPVGILDEEFVAEYGEPGIKFVMAGRVWRIIQVFRDKVYVEPDEDPVGAIPSWVGEEIPVPFFIAQEVGAIRGRVEHLTRQGLGIGEISQILSQDYPAEPEVIEASIEEIYRQASLDLPVPTDKRITVEKVSQLVILGASFGTLVNRTLARLLGKVLSDRIGETVSVFEDPYRIFLRSRGLRPEEVAEAILDMDVGGLRDLLNSTIKGSRFFRHRLLQVARRMGALGRDVEVTGSLMEQLLEGLRDTPIFQEAFEEVIQRDMNLEGAAKVLEEIKRGGIELVSLGFREEASPIAMIGLEWLSGRLESVSPERMRFLIIASTRARLLSEHRTFLCIDCKGYVGEERISHLGEVIICPLCGSKKIGMVEETPEEVYRSLDLLDRSQKGKPPKIWREALATSKLISQYGKIAAIALVGEGLTVKDVEAILKEEKRISGRLYELIHEAERKALLASFPYKKS